MNKMKSEIMVAMGEASMCWSDIGKAGKFDSTKAEAVGERLYQTLKALESEVKALREENKEMKIVLLMIANAINQNEQGVTVMDLRGLKKELEKHDPKITKAIRGEAEKGEA